MKIKTDFITNSSSSSFVVIGTNMTPSDVPDETLKKLQALDIDPEVMAEDPGEYIDKLLEGTDLNYSYGYEYYGDISIGMYYTQMNDDETLKEFKARVQQAIKDSIGIVSDVGHIEDCWRDG